MARTKQATPLRRETSSEYFSINDRTPKKEAQLSNGDALRQVAQAATPQKGDNTIIQLVIAVSGIYGSL